MRKAVHILLIEDDTMIINFLSLALKTQGYELTVETTGKGGIEAFKNLNPDIIILDLGLPDIDGNDVIIEIRKMSQIPILIVSARELEQDKIMALDAGANDYITKPFSMGELTARIRVMERFISRMNSVDNEQDTLSFGDLVIDRERRRIFLSGEEIHLTPLEYKLLILLATNHGKVITHKQIMKEVWGYQETEDPKGIRVCMAGLRRKIEKDTSDPKYILTEIGVGYRFTITNIL